ncbi:hypothetical protein NQZ68_028671 [Dissostichus eleginoides]|nr:hypothetical protein NQZ68_028671 [Dissostichus eleginoides]
MDSALFSPLENNLIDLLQVMSQVGLFHPSEPCVVPQNHPTVAEILQEIENPDTQTHMDSNQHRVQHLTSSFIPMQPQRAQDDPSVLVPIISPPELCGPGMPRRSWLLLPEGHPVWCLCPQEVPLNQPCSADMERTSQQVRDQLNIKPESAVSGNMWAKSEEEQQNIKLEDCSGSAHFLDEEILAGQSFEEYMAICDSFSTQEGNEEEENRGNLENSSFLEYLDELCSDEKRFGEAEFKPDTEFLDFFLSSDPELIDLLAQEKQEQEVTLKTENVAPAPKSDPDPIDLLSTSELVQEIRKVILEKLSYLRHDHSVTEDKYPTTSRVEETSPLQNSQAFYLVLPCSQSEIDPNHSGETSAQRTIEQKGVLPTFSPLVPSHFLGNSSFLEYLDELCCDEKFVREVEFTLDTKFLDSLLSSDPDPIDLLALEKQKVDNPNRNGENTRQRNVEPKGDLTTCSPLIPSHLLEEQLSTDYPVSATSALNHNGSLFMNFPSLQLPANVSPETSLASDLETRDNNALVEVHAAKWYESIEDVMFLLNLTDPESAQLFLESPLRGHPLAPESTSTSSVSGSNEDPCTVGVKESTPSVRDDLLTFSPPAVSVLALKTQHQIKESQEQLSPKNIDLKSSCVEAVSVQAKSSFVIDSQAVDGKLSDSVPEDKTEPTVFVVSKDLASPELRTGNQEETERQDVAETLKETATKSREERKEENTKSKTKLKVMTKTRCSQRQSGQIEKEKPRLSGEVSKERAVERKLVEKSDKKTAKCTPEMQRLVYVTQERRSFVGRELFKRLSHATEPEDTDKCSETGEKEQQKLNMEGGEQHWVDNLDMSTETGAENALLDKMPQVEKNFGKETKEKEIQMSSFVKRQTRSMTTEEKVLMTPLPATPVRRKVKSLETERNQMESSSKRDILDGDNLEVNAKEDETEPQTLSVSSPLKRSRNRSDEEVFRTNEDNVSLPESSLQSPTVQTHPHDIQDLIKDDQSRQAVPKEGLLSRINEPPSEKTCKENQNVTSPEAEQQQKTADGQSEVTGTSDVYSLRSHNVSESRTVSSKGIQENKATNEPTSVKLTADVKGEDGRLNGEEYPSSRMKRHRNEQGSSEEREAIKETDNVAIETEISSLSPTKRGRWKSGAKDHAEREEQQTLTANEKVKEGSKEKSANKPSPPSTRSSAKKDGERSRVSTGEDTFKGDSRSAMEARTSCKKARQTRLHNRLPSKYKDFILCKTNARSRRLDKDKGRTPRSGRKIGN